MAVVETNERLTWQQITEKYPAQWVGMTDVIYEEGCYRIKSAVVKYINLSMDEMALKVINEGVVDRHTNPDAVNFIGVQ